jgi:hypothetical protein
MHESWCLGVFLDKFLPLKAVFRVCDERKRQGIGKKSEAAKEDRTPLSRKSNYSQQVREYDSSIQVRKTYS